ncbi:hypothetical protein MM440_12335 [Arsenicicoccus piscis]|uniref:C2 domain-containing protein n=1 Tax=Arsenicicoccus piscis TaxID=673954 RepID=A0ABQ6HN58_9MICO|nr:hypothetical protein [Arsenicicoccus piscis]MCH8628533.1 hypothetical protein [Arsenicicoccus piscis]GMA19888.1 hypothetical protein GCM10025862_19090 [Arsenicicoccus piscis]
MATFFVDSSRQQLRATGVVDQVNVWVDDPATGRRRSSDAQEVDEQGRPLWNVEVSYLSESFGRQSTVVARVRVAAATQPTPAAFEVIHFEQLACDVRVNRAGGLVESWRADGLVSAQQVSRKQDAA